MNSIQYFIWLSEQCLVLYTWPAGIVLLLLVILITRGDSPFGWKDYLTIAFASLQLIVPFAVVGLGTLFRYKAGIRAPAIWPEWLMLLLVILQMTTGIYVVRRVHHDKMLIMALMGIEVFVTIVGIMVVSMSIGGDWM